MSDVPWAPRRTLCHRLAALAAHIKRMDSGSGDAKLMLEAATEIGRLRDVVRVNAIRHGATHAQVDEVLYAEAAHDAR